MSFSLCTYDSDTLTLLNTTINDNTVNITAAIKTGLAEEFGNDDASFTVNISWTEFGCYFESVFHFR